MQFDYFKCCSSIRETGREFTCTHFDSKLLRALFLYLVITKCLFFLLQHSRSWISEDDIYMPRLEEVPEQSEAPPPAPLAEPSQSPPGVVHRRQRGETCSSKSFWLNIFFLAVFCFLRISPYSRDSLLVKLYTEDISP